MKAILVSVSYGDLLAITLPRNAKHFERITVVSTPQDSLTAQVVAGIPNAELFTTDAFYRNGATFNKGAAMEEGFDYCGRFAGGFAAILDADIVLPAEFLDFDYKPGYLYSPYRFRLDDPQKFRDDIDWHFLPHVQDKEFAGYCQIFHGDDPVLAARPWYGTDWKHAGGCDSLLQTRWPYRRLIRLPFHVLHLGPDGTNWCGRVTPMLDGTVPAEAEQRAAQLREFMRVRQDSGGRNEHEKLGRP